MLSSQPIACTDCEGQQRIAQAARTALFPPPILPTSSGRSSAGRRVERPRGLRQKPYDLAPGIHIFAHSELSDAVATNMTAELARLHKETKTDISVPRTVRHRAADDSAAPTFHRFLNLPAEIRNCIYEHVVSKDSVLRLRCFVLPGICRASKQLREESLPLFFAQNHFVAEVKTNFVGISACSTHGSHAQYITPDDPWRFKLAGKLDLNQTVDRMLATCHPRLIKVKNIDFCMMAINRVKRRDEQYRYAILSLRHNRPDRVSIHIKEGNDAEYTKHLRRVLNQGRELLDEVVSAQDYGGVFMMQLRDIAATFVADPRGRQARLRQANDTQASALPQPGLVTAAGDGDPDEFGLQDAETYFEDNANLAMQRTSTTSTTSAIGSRDEFDLPEAEAYFV